MHPIHHPTRAISSSPHRTDIADASASAGSGNASTVIGGGNENKRREPSTSLSPSPPPKRHRTPGSHPDIAKWMACARTSDVESVSDTDESRSLEASGSIAVIPQDVIEALNKHGAVRNDKKSNPDLPATEIRIESSGAFYLLQHNMTEREGRNVGMGTVAKIRVARRHDGQMVAVKKYKVLSNDTDPPYQFTSIQRAEHEYDIYKKLGEGNHFPKVYDLAHIRKGKDIKTYLFMELIEGEDGEAKLDEISDDYISRAEAREQVKHIAHQYIEAVADMHDRGIVQFDMHLGNFMHEPSGNVKIIDFERATYYTPEQRSDPEFEEFQEDLTQLAEILESALPRALLKQLPDDEADFIFEDELPKILETEDEDIVRDVQSLRRLAQLLEDKQATPRQLLQDSYFKDNG